MWNLCCLTPAILTKSAFCPICTHTQKHRTFSKHLTLKEDVAKQVRAHRDREAYRTDMRYAIASASSSKSDSSPAGMVVAFSWLEKTYFWPQVASMWAFWWWCWCWCLCLLPPACFLTRFEFGGEASWYSPPSWSRTLLCDMALVSPTLRESLYCAGGEQMWRG